MTFKIHPCKAMPQENWGLMLQHDGICSYCGVDLEKEQLLSQLATVTAERDEARADLVGQAAEKRRLAREIDVAMHGEEGAAKQASLCDLIGPAADLRAERGAALARVVQLEGALRFYADVNNWFLEKTYTGASQICIRGNDRSDVDQGDEVYTCGGKRAREALSQSSGAELQAVRLAQAALRDADGAFTHSWAIDWEDMPRALKALNSAFGEGEVG